jgi:MFS family permease
VVYYFPVILTNSFGFSPRLALILSGADFISLMIWGSCITLLIDRLGRKPLMLIGSIGCGVCFTIVTVGLAIGTKPTYAISVSFIFGYHLFYVSPTLPYQIVSGKLICEGNVILVHSILIPFRDQLLSNAKYWQLGGHGHKLAFRLCGGDYDS